MNRNRGRNELIIYRPHFHVVTLTTPNGVEVVVRNGEVTAIYDRQGSSRIPADGYILSASGKKHGDLLAHIKQGDTGQIREMVIPERVGDSNLWASFVHIIGGGPLLLRDGIYLLHKHTSVKGLIKRFIVFGIRVRQSVKGRWHAPVCNNNGGRGRCPTGCYVTATLGTFSGMGCNGCPES